MSAVRRAMCTAAATAAALACAPGDPGGRSASTVTVLYDADERIFGPYWSVEAWFLMFLPLVTWLQCSCVQGKRAGLRDR